MSVRDGSEIVASLETTVRRERLDADAIRGRLVELLGDLARGSSADGEPLVTTSDRSRPCS